MINQELLNKLPKKFQPLFTELAVKTIPTSRHKTQYWFALKDGYRFIYGDTWTYSFAGLLRLLREDLIADDLKKVCSRNFEYAGYDESETLDFYDFKMTNGKGKLLGTVMGIKSKKYNEQTVGFAVYDENGHHKRRLTKAEKLQFKEEFTEFLKKEREVKK